MNDKKWDTHKGYIEHDNLTKLIEVLPSDIFVDSLSEIKNNKNLFHPHSLNKLYLESGPLRECISVYLTSRQNQPDLTDNFKKTIKLLMILKNKISKNSKVSRSYVTILQPGKKIYEHCDAGSGYFNSIDRYQFYLTGNSDINQIIKDTSFPALPGYFYFFDHQQVHRYENTSNEDLILMVFDLIRE